MNVPTEAIKNFTDEGAIHIVSNTFSGPSSALYNNSTINNPIEKIVQLYEEKVELHEEKVALYERMLQSEKEKVTLLEELLRDKSTTGR